MHLNHIRNITCQVSKFLTQESGPLNCKRYILQGDSDLKTYNHTGRKYFKERALSSIFHLNSL